MFHKLTKLSLKNYHITDCYPLFSTHHDKLPHRYAKTSIRYKNIYFIILLSINILSSCKQKIRIPNTESFNESEITLQFIESSKKGNLQQIKYIYSQGIDIDLADKHGRKAIVEAVKFHQLKILAFLISNGASLNDLISDMTPLMWAAYFNNLTATRLLINSKAKLNIVNSRSWSALHYAALLGRKDILKELVRAGADVNIASETGLTALMKCAGLNHSDALKVLLDLGANIKKTDHKGRTALMYAAAMGRVETLDVLISAGAVLETKDYDGNTALMLATTRQKNIVRNHLLLKGTSLN